jgi:SAM-dependent methyltransferase
VNETSAASRESQFDLIAPYYDALMAGVPYGLWVGYLEDILRRLDYHPKTVLDVACGTGNVSERLSQRGYDLVGVDIAPGMIEVAREKRSPIEYHVQDMAELDLGRQFDLAISLFDSLNYVTDTDRLRLGMRKVAEHLNDGGVFIFDVNTEYALAHGFFNQANLDSRNYPKYVWSSEYDRTARICTVTMVFEVMEGTETRQFTEVHRQRGYTLEELGDMVKNAGMELLETFHAYTLKRPGRRSDRVFFVARKPEEKS